MELPFDKVLPRSCSRSLSVGHVTAMDCGKEVRSHAAGAKNKVGIVKSKDNIMQKTAATSY